MAVRGTGTGKACARPAESLNSSASSGYKQFVEGLETFKGHDDDKRRKKKRKDLLLLPAYEEKEFVPRDLTTTSQTRAPRCDGIAEGLHRLRESARGRLAARLCHRYRAQAWKVLGCLSLANPQVLDENGDVKKKDDIRDITTYTMRLMPAYWASHRFIPNNAACGNSS